jgi:glycosyltransferase involved in cell wall biosynthesis
MPDISLILTYYNESLILKQSIRKIDEFLSMTKLNVELIFIDDNSNDESPQILNSLKGSVLNKHNCQFIRNITKNGRGACVDQGFKLAKSDIVGFIDTDLDIPIHYVLPAYIEFKNNNLDVLIGRRSFLFRFSKFIRILMTQTYSLIIRKYLNFPYQQTEAGFKFFRKDVYLTLSKHIVEKHWSWDTEVMMLSNYYNLRVYEMPITVIHQDLRPTNVEFFKDTVNSLKNSAKIKKRINNIRKNDTGN